MSSTVATREQESNTAHVTKSEIGDGYPSSSNMKLSCSPVRQRDASSPTRVLHYFTTGDGRTLPFRTLRALSFPMPAFDLHTACLEGKAGLVAQFLESLTSSDAKSQVTAKDADGRTPLHWAASSGKVELVRTLLDAGAELDVGDGSGWPPLMIASSAGCTEIVQELLYRGADPNTQNPRGLTSLHYAASKGHVDIGSALLAAGADVNARDKSKQVPLHRASSAAREAFIKLLLNPPARKDGISHAKTRVNPADHLGNTPLHAAFETGSGAAAVLLIEEGGADRERQNADGQVAEEIEGVGGNEQRRVRDFVRSRVGPRDE